MRKRIPVTFLLIPLLFIACAGESESETAITEEVTATAGEQFFANLSSLCGETFTGGAGFPDDPSHELVDVALRATVETCSDEEIRVPFIAGEDESRTWVFTKSERGVHLRHDHRYPDGTPHDLTDYGGYANEQGDEWTQYFAADLLTAEMLPEAETNVWMVEIDAENGKMTYYLERHSEPRFRAELFRTE